MAALWGLLDGWRSGEGDGVGLRWVLGHVAIARIRKNINKGLGERRGWDGGIEVGREGCGTERVQKG